MKLTFKSSLKAGVLGVMSLGLFAACADDGHFDIANGSGGNGQTIWANIQQNPQLRNLQYILQGTYLMRYETDKINPETSKTLADLLDSPQSFTVWAPLDDTYDAHHYLNILEKAKEEFATKGVTTDYLKMQYEVANQFVYNHVARFGYESDPNEQEVNLLNAKKVAYSAGANSFNGVNITGAPVVSSNGTMHLLSGASPFAYNIYDFISAKSNMTNLSAYLLDPSVDHYTFNEGSSVKGALNENGDQVYVDSVYSHTNEIVDYCGARIQNEDSMYVAILPTDVAWDGAVNRLKSYFKYNTSYYYDWSTSTGKFNNASASTAYKLDADSLQDRNVRALIFQSAFFSPSIWSNMSVKSDSASIVNYALTADSLISTNNTTFYNSNKGGVNPMFNGQKPEKASNGYIFAVDDYQIKPEYTWMKRQEMDATQTFYMAQPSAESCHCTERNGSTLTFTNDNRNTYSDPTLPDSLKKLVYDPYDVPHYQCFTREGRNNMTVGYMLSNLLSGSYTIKAIMLPMCANLDLVPDPAAVTPQPDETFYVQVLDDKGNPLEIELGNNGTSAKNKVRSADITVSQTEVKEYTLVEKINIPYCYFNLPNGVDSFCRLKFTCTYDRGVTRNGLNIYKIIIEPYRK